MDSQQRNDIDCTDKYIALFNKSKTTFTWDRVSAPVFIGEDDKIYACKNIPIKTKMFEYLPERSEFQILDEVNEKLKGKHLYIFSIIETPRMIVSPEKRPEIKLTNQRVTVPIYNPFTFQEQMITLDKAFIIKGVFIKAAIKGSSDEIFTGTKDEIRKYLIEDLKIKPYPVNGILQESGNYEMVDTKIEQQLNNNIANPTQIFYLKAEVNEYKLLTTIVVSIPVYIKEKE